MKRKIIFPIGALGIAFTLGLSLIGDRLPFSSLFASNVGTARNSQVSHHFADQKDLGEVTYKSYTVTDTSNGYYYTGYVNSGTFSESGLSLTAGNYFQADIKGAHTVGIDATSGTFDIYLSNDNVNFTASRRISNLSSQPFVFRALMRYVRITCVADGVLTDIKITCACSEDYFLSTQVAMTESVWTNDVTTNKVTFVGNQKSTKTGLQDFDHLTFYGTRDAHGVYVYAEQRVAYQLMTHATDWWLNSNFEFRFNNTGDVSSTRQLYASTLATNPGNFDIVSYKIHDKISQYDLWHLIEYKCFVSYEQLSYLSGINFAVDTPLYIWWGSRSTDSLFNACSFWEQDSTMQITTTGILNNGALNGTFIDHSINGWAGGHEYIVTTRTEVNKRYVASLHLNGGIGGNSTDFDSIKYKTTLAALRNADHLDDYRTFRLDWCSFGGNGYADGNVQCNNGTVWESGDRFCNTIIDCEIVYLFQHTGTVCNIMTVIFPNNRAAVGRHDFYMSQSLTVTDMLDIKIASEWSTYTIYNQ